MYTCMVYIAFPYQLSQCVVNIKLISREQYVRTFEKCQLTILAARVDKGGFHYQLLLAVWCDIGKIITA